MRAAAPRRGPPAPGPAEKSPFGGSFSGSYRHAVRAGQGFTWGTWRGKYAENIHRTGAARVAALEEHT